MPNVANPAVIIRGRDSEGNSIYSYWPTPRITTTASYFSNINHWMMREDGRYKEAGDIFRYIRTAFPLMPPWKDDVVVLFPKDTMRRQPHDPDDDPRIYPDLHPERNPVAVAARLLPPMIRMGEMRWGKIKTAKILAEPGSRSDGYQVRIDAVSESGDWVSGHEGSIHAEDDNAEFLATFPRTYADPEDAPGPAVRALLDLSETSRNESNTYDDMNFAPDDAPDTETDIVSGFGASRMAGWRPGADGETLTEYRETWSIIAVQPPLPLDPGELDTRPPGRRMYRYKYRIEFHSVTEWKGEMAWTPGRNYFSGGTSQIIIPYLKQTKTIEYRGKFYRGASSENLAGAVIKFYTVLPEFDNQDLTLDTATKSEVATINVASLPTDPAKAQTISFKFTPRIAIDPGTGVGYTRLCYRCECGPETYYSVGTVADATPPTIDKTIIAGKVNNAVAPGEYETGFTATMGSTDWSPAIGAVITTPEAHAEYLATFPRDEPPANIADFHLEESGRDNRDTYKDMAPDTMPDTETSSASPYGARRGWTFTETSRERTYTQKWTVTAVQEPVPPATEYRYKYHVEISDITVVRGDVAVSTMFGGGSAPVVVTDPEASTVGYSVSLAGTGYTGSTNGMAIKFYAVRPENGNPNQTLDASTKEEIGSVDVASLVASPGNAQKFTFNFTPLTAIDPTTTATYTMVAWRCECGEDSSFSVYRAVEDINDGKRSGVFVQDAEGKTLPNPPAPFGAWV